MLTEREYRASTAVHAAEIDGDVLLWDGRAQELHHLNRSASRIWLALSSWRRAAQVVDVLRTAPSGPPLPAEGEQEVRACLEDLARAGLLDERAARAPSDR